MAFITIYFVWFTCILKPLRMFSRVCMDVSVWWNTAQWNEPQDYHEYLYGIALHVGGVDISADVRVNKVMHAYVMLNLWSFKAFSFKTRFSDMKERRQNFLSTTSTFVWIPGSLLIPDRGWQIELVYVKNKLVKKKKSLIALRMNQREVCDSGQDWTTKVGVMRS